MSVTASDYKQKNAGAGSVFVDAGVWVRAVNNSTGLAYVSSSATDANGLFTLSGIPPGYYTLSTGLAQGGPTWTPTGDTAYCVPVGDQINWDQTHPIQTLYGSGFGTGLTSSNPYGPIKLEASLISAINDVAHDYNIAMNIQNWTADAAGITLGNNARGDGLYAQATDASGFLGGANAINVYAGGLSIFPTDSGSGGTVTYDATSVTDTSKAWTINQWVGRYALIGNFGLAAKLLYITSNTATKLIGALGWLSQVGANQAALQTGAATPANGTAYLIPKSNATGGMFGRFSMGNAIKVVGQVGSGLTGGNDYPGHANGDDYLINVLNSSISVSLGIQDNGSTTVDTVVISSSSKTTGNFIQIFGGTSVFSGAGLYLNFGNGGAFTGRFIDATIGNVSYFRVDAAGNIGIRLGAGLDVLTAGTLNLGTATANLIVVGKSGVATQILGGWLVPNNVVSQLRLQNGTGFNFFYIDAANTIKLGGVDGGAGTTLHLYADQTDILDVVHGGIGNIQVLGQVYPGDQAGGMQTSGGLLHAVGVPSNANGNNNDWALSDTERLYVKIAGTWTTPSATLKKGSGGGNYVTASAAYVDVDAANLGLTITIPTNWKLTVIASGQLTSATAVATVSVSLFDAATLIEAQVNPTVAGVAGAEDWTLNYVINGDGNSHTVKLQYKTSNVADSATILNSSATLLPSMTFLLMPSG